MADNKAFSLTEYDLGTDSSIGFSRSEVSHILRDSQFDSTLRCFICGGTATHRLIAKKPEYNTAEIQDRGVVCSNCLLCNPNIDKKKYGIRPLKP